MIGARPEEDETPVPHCPPEQLDDIADVLSQVRGWERIIEKKRGIFYLGREPFLHFHLVEGGRRQAGCSSIYHDPPP